MKNVRSITKKNILDDKQRIFLERNRLNRPFDSYKHNIAVILKLGYYGSNDQRILNGLVTKWQTLKKQA